MAQNKPEITSPRMSAGSTFAALRHRNYRLWFIGQLISLMGTWMQNTAQGFLMYELTRDPAFLGLVTFVYGVPSWLLMLYAGVVSDRMSRRKLLILTQTAMMVLAFAIAALVFTGVIQTWHILVMAFLLGVANAFDAPARQAFVVEMIERQDLTNAIALNATMFNAATIVGPSIAGITYAAFGPQWCFLINALSFIAVIIALALMKLKPISAPLQRGNALKNIKEGLSFAWSNSTIRLMTINAGVITMFGMGMMSILPAWSVNILGGDVMTNGLLVSTRGAGSVVGGLLVASLGARVLRGKLWNAGMFIMPVALLAFALVNQLPLSLLALFFCGFSFLMVANTSNALVQTNVPDHLRGRVMSIFTMVFFGGMPLGALIVGLVASQAGEVAAVIMSAAALACFTLVIFFKVPGVRKLQ